MAWISQFFIESVHLRFLQRRLSNRLLPTHVQGLLPESTEQRLQMKYNRNKVSSPAEMNRKFIMQGTFLSGRVRLNIQIIEDSCRAAVLPLRPKSIVNFIERKLPKSIQILTII